MNQVDCFPAKPRNWTKDTVIVHALGGSSIVTSSPAAAVASGVEKFEIKACAGKHDEAIVHR
jgi:hypothetical protein